MEAKMPTQDERVKKYIVRLSEEERSRLEDMVHKGKASARLLTRARVLLKADVSEAGEGWSDSRIMEALEVSAALVYDVRRQLVEEGFEAAVTRKKRSRPPTPSIFDGEKEAKLIALSCSKPPAGYARWSLRLLENKVVELEIVDQASDSTIGRVLKKTFCSPIATSNGSFRRKRTARS
jgi:homeodomain-containing protein